MNDDIEYLLLREWEINPRKKKIQDPPGIWTQELLNTSQDTLTIKTLDWTPGRGVEDNSAIYKTALG